MMIGAHFLLFSKNPEADRVFFRDVLKFPAVDSGGGWLIFGLPRSELGVHPAEGDFVQRHAEHDMLGVVLYLMCDDVAKEIASLEARGVKCSRVEEAEWGLASSISLPSGGKIGLYQPMHLTAFDLASG